MRAVRREDSRGEGMCSTGFAWRSDQGQVYPGVPHRDSLIGIASLLVPFGLSSNIYNDSTHPPRAMGGRVVGEPACQALCHPDSHSSEILGPQRRNMGTPLENPEPGSRHSLLQDSAASTWGWGWAESGNLVPRSGLLAPILDVFEVQSYLVSQNSGPGL